MRDRTKAAFALRNEIVGPERPLISPKGPEKFTSWKLPPVSGDASHLRTHKRIWHIVQIAMIAIMGMTAAVITIAGLVNLFTQLSARP